MDARCGYTSAGLTQDRVGRYGLVVVQTPVTLAELATVLATPGLVHEVRITRALNLGDGSSAALGARTSSAGDLSLPEGRPVRNFRCVQPVR